MELSDDPTDDPTDDYKEVKVSSDLPDAYWTQLVSNFMESHNPATCLQVVFGLFNHSIGDRKVTVNLNDPQPVWKRMWSRALVHAINLPQAFNGSRTNGIPLTMDTGASVCITPCQDDFTLY